MHQHHPASPHPEGGGGAGDAGSQDFWRGAREGLPPVVLREPVAIEAEGFHMLGEAHGFPERLDRRAPRTDRGLVQYAEAHGRSGLLEPQHQLRHDVALHFVRPRVDGGLTNVEMV